MNGDPVADGSKDATTLVVTFVDAFNELSIVFDPADDVIGAIDVNIDDDVIDVDVVDIV